MAFLDFYELNVYDKIADYGALEKSATDMKRGKVLCSI